MQLFMHAGATFLLGVCFVPVYASKTLKQWSSNQCQSILWMFVARMIQVQLHQLARTTVL